MFSCKNLILCPPGGYRVYNTLKVTCMNLESEIKSKSDVVINIDSSKKCARIIFFIKCLRQVNGVNIESDATYAFVQLYKGIDLNSHTSVIFFSNQFRVINVNTIFRPVVINISHQKYKYYDYNYKKFYEQEPIGYTRIDYWNILKSHLQPIKVMSSSKLQK